MDILLYLDTTVIKVFDIQDEVCMTTDPAVLDIANKVYSNVHAVHEGNIRQEFGPRAVKEVYDSAGEFWYFQLSPPPAVDPLSPEKLRADIDFLMLSTGSLNAEIDESLGLDSTLTNESENL